MSWTSRRSLGFSSFLIRFVLNRTTFGRKLECFIYSTITFHKLFFTLLPREQALVEGLGLPHAWDLPLSLCVPGSLFHRSKDKWGGFQRFPLNPSYICNVYFIPSSLRGNLTSVWSKDLDWKQHATKPEPLTQSKILKTLRVTPANCSEMTPPDHCFPNLEFRELTTSKDRYEIRAATMAGSGTPRLRRTFFTRWDKNWRPPSFHCYGAEDSPSFREMEPPKAPRKWELPLFMGGLAGAMPSGSETGGAVRPRST